MFEATQFPWVNRNRTTESSLLTYEQQKPIQLKDRDPRTPLLDLSESATQQQRSQCVYWSGLQNYFDIFLKYPWQTGTDPIFGAQSLDFSHPPFPPVQLHFTRRFILLLLLLTLTPYFHPVTWLPLPVRESENVTGVEASWNTGNCHSKLSLTGSLLSAAMADSRLAVYRRCMSVCFGGVQGGGGGRSRAADPKSPVLTWGWLFQQR